MKPKFQYRMWVKALSFVLLLASLLTAALSGAGLFYGYAAGAYSGRTFWTSDLSASAMWSQLNVTPDDLTGYFRTQYEVAHDTATDTTTAYTADTTQAHSGWGAAQQDVQTGAAYLADQVERTFDPAISNLRARYTRKVSSTAPAWVDTLGYDQVTAQFSSDLPISSDETPAIQTIYTAYDTAAETLEIGIDRALRAPDSIRAQFQLFDSLQRDRSGLTVKLVLGVLLFLVCFIHLLAACGHRPDQPGCLLRWCDRVPYLVVLCVLSLPLVLGIGCIVMAGETGALFQIILFGLLGLSLQFLSGFLLLMTTVARCKTHMFWRTTLTYHVCTVLGRGAGRVKQYADDRKADKLEAQTSEEIAQAIDLGKDGAARAVHSPKALILLGERVKSIEWDGVARAGHGAAGLLRGLTGWLRARIGGLRAGFAHLSLTWQGVLVGAAVIGCFLFIVLMTGVQAEEFLVLILFGALVLIGLIRLLGQMAALQQGAQRLATGDLDDKIPTEHLRGPFRMHAEQLNAISQGMAVAVEHRLKSEKLKTELLTNVSHDIKTPLTSIINYVDLLQKTDLQPEAAREYAAVLERQSQRLKKLLEDLIEASKASTGNVNVELAPTDAAELLRQAAGEYNERFQKSDLSPVIRIGAADCTITADGRLLWRVFDNLLGNIVKYAMPSTRVYLDISPAGGRTCISLKNISRDELNIDTEELMERFVRGDVSRATEGSGLGLSIARSLTECMGGTFALAIDGDLFKVTLGFANPEEGQVNA